MKISLPIGAAPLPESKKLRIFSVIIATTVALLFFIGHVTLTPTKRPSMKDTSLPLLAPSIRSNTLFSPFRRTEIREAETTTKISFDSEVLPTIDALKLFRHNLSKCAADGNTVPVEVETNAALQRNIQCWCAERTPIDNKNCLFRLNKAVIHRRFMTRIDHINTIIYVHSPTLFPWSIRVQSTYMIEIRGYLDEGWHPLESKRRMQKLKKGKPKPKPGAKTSPKKVEANFERRHRPILSTVWDAPVLLIPDAVLQESFYHMIMGPAGLMQIVATRGAIDRFYTDVNAMLSNAISQLNASHSAILPIELQGEVVRSFADNEGPSKRFVEYPLHHTLDSYWQAARCRALRGMPAPNNPPNSKPKSFIAQELLYNRHALIGITNGTLDSMSAFADEFGFCQHLLPAYSFTTIHNDLWIGKILGMAGRLETVRRHQYLMQQSPYAYQGQLRIPGPNLHLDVPKEIVKNPKTFLAYTTKNEPVPILMDEFAALCPLTKEELIGAKLVAGQIERAISVFGRPEPESKNASTAQRCVNVSRVRKGAAEVFCTAVVGRELEPTFDFRTRGLPPNIEIAVLDALLAPLDSATLPLPSTPQGEVNVSKWWSRSSNERSASCSSNKQRPTSLPLTAAEILEANNYDSGLAPCAAPPQAVTDQARAQYPNGTGAFHIYEGLAFRNTSKWFDASTIRRTDYGKHGHVRDQFAAVKETNLFIFEEGASATWSLFAPHGSTFIIIYNYNMKRADQFAGQANTVAYHVAQATKPKKGSRKGRGASIKVVVDLPLPEEVRPHTEHFLFQPEITQNVRSIFLIYQDGRFPSFAKLREVFDWPWRPESIFIGCECNETRIAPYSAVRRPCF